MPVVEDDNYKFHLTLETPEGMYGATSVTYINYSKLWDFTTDTSKITNKTTIQELYAAQPKPSSIRGYKEPALVLGEDDLQYDYLNYTNVYKRASSTSLSKVKFTSTDGLSAFATQLKDDYDNMITSISKYKGFYIGRYEITSNGEKGGVTLTNRDWYQLYNECMFLNKEANTETSMIYGTLWDATMKWLADKNYNVGYMNGEVIGYGNYKYVSVEVKNKNTIIKVKPKDISLKLETGQTSYTKSNNIYDLAGNCNNWTQEALNNERRVFRSVAYWDDSANHEYTNAYPAKRGNTLPTYKDSSVSSRANLYIK